MLLIKVNMKEIWNDIPGYEGFYEASNLGVIKSISREVVSLGGFRTIKAKILSKQIMNTGYYTTMLSCEGTQTRHLVHRLVGKAFLGENTNLVVNHKDGNKLNNNISNIEFVTQKENVNHSLYILGNKNSLLGGGKRGDSVNSRGVFQIFNDKTRKFHTSIRGAAQDVGLKSQSSIVLCCQGKRNTAAGYNWEYS